MKDGAKWGLFGHGDEADAHEAELVVALFPEGEVQGRSFRAFGRFLPHSWRG